MAKEIPVYVIAGMLDAGKTAFINDTLRDGFARQIAPFDFVEDEPIHQFQRPGKQRVGHGRRVQDDTDSPGCRPADDGISPADFVLQEQVGRGRV